MIENGKKIGSTLILIKYAERIECRKNRIQQKCSLTAVILLIYMKSFVIIFIYTVTKIDLIDYSRTMKLDYLLIVMKRVII